MLLKRPIHLFSFSFVNQPPRLNMNKLEIQLLNWYSPGIRLVTYMACYVSGLVKYIRQQKGFTEVHIEKKAFYL